MIKKFLLLVLLGLFISACTTTPEQDQGPEVVDKTGSAGVTDDGAGAAETGSGGTGIRRGRRPGYRTAGTGQSGKPAVRAGHLF